MKPSRKILFLLLALVLLLPPAAKADPPDDICNSLLSVDGHHDWQVLKSTPATCLEQGFTVWKCANCDRTYQEFTPTVAHTWDPWEEYPRCEQEGIRQRRCQVCRSLEIETIPPVEHQWSDWTLAYGSQPPTCTTGSMDIRACARCGKTETREIPELGHDWDQGHASLAPTCASPGVRVYTCLRCYETRMEAIDKLPHQPQTVYEIYPTCVQSGISLVRCTLCGENLTNPDTVPPLGHDWDEGQVTAPATCVSTGVMTFTCRRCGDTRTETIDKKGHTYEQVIEVYPTCTEPGSAFYKCAVCGEKLTDPDSLPALGHDWDNGNVVREATCTDDGAIVYACSRCGVNRTELIPAAGHTWQEIPAKEPTCTEPGSTSGMGCSVCGATQDQPQEIPALGHDWDNGTVTLSPTCTSPGAKTYVCVRCGADRMEVIAALGHQIVTAPGYPATCTVPGLSEGKTCSRCGAVLAAQTVIPATGHSWDKFTVNKEPTCTESGMRTWHCGNDPSHIKTEIMPATGHSPVTLPAAAATCTSDGKTAGSVCSACGAVLVAQQDIPALGHAWSAWITDFAPTCVNPGRSHRSCVRCKATQTESIPARGHAAIFSPAVAATCTEPGHTDGELCAVCGETLSYWQDIPALGHDWSDWITDAEPSCTDSGKQRRACVRCGLEEDAPIPVLGHDWDEGEITKPVGLMTPGEKTYTCARCGETKTEEIPCVNKPDAVLPLLRNEPPEAADGSGGGLWIVREPEGGVAVPDGAVTHLLSVEAEGGLPPYNYEWHFVAEKLPKVTANNLNGVDCNAVKHAVAGAFENRRDEFEKAGEKGSSIVSSLFHSLTGASFILKNSNEEAVSPLTPLEDLNDQIVASGLDAEYAASQPGEYYCVVSDQTGDRVSSVRVTVTEALYIAMQPNNANLRGQESVTVTCKAGGGSGAYLYSFRNAETGELVETQLFEGNVTVSVPGVYVFEADDFATGELAVSDPFHVYDAEPLAVSGLSDVALNEEESAVLTLTVTGGVEPYAFRWRRQENDLTSDFPSFADLSDSMESSLTVTGAEPGRYQVVVTDAMGETASASAVVASPLTIIRQPEGVD